MWKRAGIVRVGAAIVLTVAGWILVRLVLQFDYFPPESLVSHI